MVAVLKENKEGCYHYQPYGKETGNDCALFHSCALPDGKLPRDCEARDRRFGCNVDRSLPRSINIRR